MKILPSANLFQKWHVQNLIYHSLITTCRQNKDTISQRASISTHVIHRWAEEWCLYHRHTEWLTIVCQAMNLMEWAALQWELWPLVHTQTRNPCISHAPWKMLGSHTRAIRPSQPFLLSGGMDLASSQYSYMASGPQHHKTRARNKPFTKRQ